MPGEEDSVTSRAAKRISVAEEQGFEKAREQVPDVARHNGGVCPQGC